MSTLFGWDGPYSYFLAAAVAAILFFVLKKLSRKKSAESRYVEALSALLAGDEEKALADLRQTVQAEQSNIDAYLRLGNLLRKRGAVNRALRIHRDLDVGTFFRRKLTAAEKFRIREAIADDLLAARRPDEALATLDELLRREKTNRRIRRKMVALHERRSEWERAFELYRDGFKVRKESAPDRVARYRAFCGASLLAAGDRAGATRVFQDALKIDPSSPEALYRLGALRLDEGNADDAVGLWKRFHQTCPLQAWLTFDRLEGALFETGDLNQVERIYNAILDDEPDEERTMIALSKFYMRKGDSEEALRLARRVAEKHPLSLEAQEHYLLLVTRADGEGDRMETIRKYLESRRRGAVDHVCSRCGHSSPDPFWRCPKCLDWNTSKPAPGKDRKSVV